MKLKLSIFLILLSIIAVALLSFSYGQRIYEPKVVSYMVTEYVDREVIETKYVEVVKEVEVIKEIYTPLKFFESREELKRWLKANPVSEREYVKDVYDCVQFTRDLAFDAAKDGYNIGFAVTSNHVANVTFIGNDVIWINADNDTFSTWGQLNNE